jgi:hypothetical protein
MARWTLPGLGILIAVSTLGFVVSPPVKDPKFKLTDSCTYLTASGVRKAFGPPATPDPTNRGTPLPGVCDYLVGNDGAVIAITEYPGPGTVPGQNAVDQIETQQAQKQLLGTSVEQVSVGRHAYLELDQHQLGVAASTKFAFLLRWDPPTGLANPPSATVVNQRLVDLAKLVIRRSGGR